MAPHACRTVSSLHNHYITTEVGKAYNGSAATIPCLRTTHAKIGHLGGKAPVVDEKNQEDLLKTKYSVTYPWSQDKVAGVPKTGRKQLNQYRGHNAAKFYIGIKSCLPHKHLCNDLASKEQL